MFNPIHLPRPSQGILFRPLGLFLVDFSGLKISDPRRIQVYDVSIYHPSFHRSIFRHVLFVLQLRSAGESTDGAGEVTTLSKTSLMSTVLTTMSPMDPFKVCGKGTIRR